MRERGKKANKQILRDKKIEKEIYEQNLYSLLVKENKEK
jgi:hypothetical protein